MTPRDHADRIAESHGLTLEQVIEQDKRAITATVRHQVWLDVCLELDWSTSQVARRLKRDHSTIIYGRQRAASARFGLPSKAHWPEIQEAARFTTAQEEAA
jgi:hypothetical protein